MSKDLEPEIVFYAKLKDVEELKQAIRVIGQEQYQKREGDMTVRVRKEQENGKTEYIFTTKVGKGSVRVEKNMETIPELFEAMKLWSEGKGGMIKDRFIFPVNISDYVIDGVPEELFWEIDVFFKEDGSYEDWVKIDLEFKVNKEGHVVIPKEIPALPITFLKVISGATKDETERAVISRLYETVFLS